jgi:hypothetical protein
MEEKPILKNMLITPEMAKMFLKKAEETHFKNRKVNEATVKKYAEAMKNGEWVMNGQTIVFDETSTPTNGFHRLNAVIKADTPIWFSCASNVRREYVRTMDTGRKRSAEDDLDFLGIERKPGILKVVRQKLSLDKNRKWKDSSESVSGITSKMQCDEYISKKPFYDKILEQARKWEESSKKTLAYGLMGGICAFLIDSFGWEEDTVYDFFTRLADTPWGEKSIFGVTAKEVSKSVGTPEKINEYIYGWNSYVRGRKEKRILEFDWFIKNPNKKKTISSNNCVGVGITSDDLGITNSNKEMELAMSEC